MSLKGANLETPRFSFAEFDRPCVANYDLAAGESVTLVAVERGCVTIQNDDTCHDLRHQHCGLFISSRSTTFSCQAEEDERVVSCSARLSSFPALANLGSSIEHKLTTDRIPTLFRLGINLATANSPADLHLRDTLGEALLRAFIAERETGYDIAPPSFVRKTQSYFHQYFAEPCALDKLATFVGVRKEYLISEFRRHVGQTPMRYLWDLRTRRAAQLVQTTTMTLAEIASHTGYKSQFHLSREIKRMTGVSPRDLRRSPNSHPIII
jgi:AraC family L-rhamnose operon regulatory protein RhaS